MKYIYTRKKYNEGLRTGIASAGLVGSLLTGSGDINAQKTNDISVVDINKFNDTKSNIKELSLIRKESVNKDMELSNILFEIERNTGGDSTKFVQLFQRLSTHIESKYGYKIESRKIEELSPSGEVPKDLTLFEILGWLGSICLAICGIPQAWQSYKDKNSECISWGFVLLWAFGEIFALAYVYDKLDLPLVLNYATNILILGVILYYKVKPGQSNQLSEANSIYSTINESTVLRNDIVNVRKINDKIYDIFSKYNIRISYTRMYLDTYIHPGLKYDIGPTKNMDIYISFREYDVPKSVNELVKFLKEEFGSEYDVKLKKSKSCYCRIYIWKKDMSESQFEDYKLYMKGKFF